MTPEPYSKEDFKQCVHDLGTVWSYYPENNYGTQARYGKIGNSLCPFCKFNRLEDGLKKLDEQNTYFREQANHWNTLAEKVTLENESLKAENEQYWALAKQHQEALKSSQKALGEMKLYHHNAKEEVHRLSSALARAHEALKPFSEEYNNQFQFTYEESNQSLKNLTLRPNDFEKAMKVLSDHTGQTALERWKKMEAVVEAARACYEEDDFITENSPGSFERDKKLGEALEALDAKGASDV